MPGCPADPGYSSSTLAVTDSPRFSSGATLIESVQLPSAFTSAGPPTYQKAVELPATGRLSSGLAKPKIRAFVDAFQLRMLPTIEMIWPSAVVLMLTATVLKSARTGAATVVVIVVEDGLPPPPPPPPESGFWSAITAAVIVPTMAMKATMMALQRVTQDDFSFGCSGFWPASALRLSPVGRFRPGVFLVDGHTASVCDH
jgi:hypothetical protein